MWIKQATEYSRLGELFSAALMHFGHTGGLLRLSLQCVPNRVLVLHMRMNLFGLIDNKACSPAQLVSSTFRCAGTVL